MISLFPALTQISHKSTHAFSIITILYHAMYTISSIYPSARRKKAKQQVTTIFITFCIIMGGRSLIIYAGHKGPKYASFATILCNLLAQHVVRKLTSYKSHRNKSLRTPSQYLKITAFQWSIVVFIPILITDFSSMLDREGIIKIVMVLLLAECIQRPIIQLIGIGVFLKRRIFGPRAEDERRINL